MAAADFGQSLAHPVPVDTVVGFNRSQQKRPGEALQQSLVTGVLLMHDLDDLGSGLTMHRGKRAVHAEHASMEENLGTEHGNGHVDGVGCAEGSHAAGDSGSDKEVRVFLDCSVMV